jgi:hypothetical protein
MVVFIATKLQAGRAPPVAAIKPKIARIKQWGKAG